MEHSKNSLLYSKSLSVARKEVPADSPSRNHQLLIQAGFVRQEGAGIYTILPFGMRVMDNIEHLVRDEMEGLGAQEIAMPSLTPKENWVQTDRWNEIDVLFQVKSRTGNREYGLAPTTEEVAAPIAKDRIRSYRDLPFAFYQFGRKFRDEKRAKSGMIRGREFSMKDMYSFHATQGDFLDFYGQASEAYLRIFNACGVNAKITEASGGEYTKKMTHEFHAISDAGEDNIAYCGDCTFAQNVEISKYHIGDECGKCGDGTIGIAKSIEIGHIFDLGSKFTSAFNIKFQDKDGSSGYPVMGCYGIGISRLMGTVTELHNDDRGIIWPRSVSPFDIHLVGLNLADEGTQAKAFDLYTQLSRMGYSVLFDDRSAATVKEKFFLADLVGIPDRLVISSRTAETDSVEYKSRSSSESLVIENTNLEKHLAALRA